MCTNHGNWVSCLPFVSDCKRNDRRAIASKVVFTSGDEGRVPAIAFFDFGEACFCKTLDARMNSMVSCRIVSNHRVRGRGYTRVGEASTKSKKSCALAEADEIGLDAILRELRVV